MTLHSFVAKSLFWETWEMGPEMKCGEKVNSLCGNGRTYINDYMIRKRFSWYDMHHSPLSMSGAALLIIVNLTICCTLVAMLSSKKKDGMSCSGWQVVVGTRCMDKYNALCEATPSNLRGNLSAAVVSADIRKLQIHLCLTGTNSDPEASDETYFFWQ